MGQFIRWADPQVEENHYHNHTGDWPHPSRQEWLQWTASPPNIADLDLDGRNEIVGVPNIEFNVPYETQAYAVMVLEGSHGDGSRSAMRRAGWESLPRGMAPVTVDGLMDHFCMISPFPIPDIMETAMVRRRWVILTEMVSLKLSFKPLIMG
jgi:hypothetical protein